MKRSYWLYKMCLLLGLGICIPVTGNASDIGDATLTQQQSKITASGVVVDESGESLIELPSWKKEQQRMVLLQT